MAVDIRVGDHDRCHLPHTTPAAPDAGRALGARLHTAHILLDSHAVHLTQEGKEEVISARTRRIVALTSATLDTPDQNIDYQVQRIAG